MTAPLLAIRVLVSTFLAYYAIASINISGLVPHDFNAASIIQIRCPVHIVPPGRIKGTNQADILFYWAKAETKARLAIVGIGWVLTIGLLFTQHLRKPNQKLPAAAG